MFDMFVDWNRGVDYMRNNSLSFDNGLNVVVDVMVDMLANNYIVRVGSLDGKYLALVFEFAVLSCKRCCDLSIFPMVESPMLNRDNIVVVLLRFYNLGLNRLDMDLVVVLMDLSVERVGNRFMLLFLDPFMQNSGLGLLLNVNGMLVPVV